MWYDNDSDMYFTASYKKTSKFSGFCSYCSMYVSLLRQCSDDILITACPMCGEPVECKPAEYDVYQSYNYATVSC